MIPLDKNESYWLLDETLTRAALGAGDRTTLSQYPSYEALEEALASYALVPREAVLVTPGSDAAIEHIARQYAGKRAVLPVPTFYGYEKILDRAGVETIPVAYREEAGTFVFPIDAVVRAIADGAGIIFLCQPNNPLGCGIPREHMVQVLEAARTHGAVVVSDEAYFEFSERTLVKELASSPHLIITRTLSKGFGLSGARVGYVLASPETIAHLRAQMLPWPVARASVAAAEALLARAGAVRARVEAVAAEREHFREALAALPGVTAYSSETNFVLVRVPDARAAQAALTEGGVRSALGAPMSRFPEAAAVLAETLRLAVPSPEDRPVVESVLTDIAQMEITW